ncbi:hypothetical protein HOK68_04355 [Candidatus Woesearchaeota archaeon]|jgi:hypothetical protein|nr:hypothetical protein [Candidatus Woesearchaeota archaeon]MBT4387280.1 hypothetical protein [Candidatus Woesearchaeota archaeon]MBT4595419.1 hypothetical protein [Candidatus Woesearchaeota archaeon]MBT5741134.1 hypothetical protein [Candidatus Woesearchaeota archaeon]MBT6505983.1 hypothetical protein [Candidatus Woesearchaeota archaeon]
MKKGQGLSMNMIVIAIIAILVLVIISVIFTGNLGKTKAKLADCSTKGGQCMTKSECNELQGISDPTTACSVDTAVCCLGGNEPASESQ